MKVAKLITVSLVTRVIVDSESSEVDIANAAKDSLKEQIENEIHDNVESIVDDSSFEFRFNPSMWFELLPEL